MSEYTSSLEGYQRAMQWSLDGPPEDAKAYTDALSTPTFVHYMNGTETSYEEYVKGISEWRSKVSDYKPVVTQFLRDGDQLAARMTGTIKVDGAETAFESFMFAKIEKESGKMEWLIERSILGPVGGATEHGVN